MPGLVPGIFFAAPKRMAGTSPAMMAVEKHKQTQTKMAGTCPAISASRMALAYAGTSCLPNSFSFADDFAVAQRKFHV